MDRRRVVVTGLAALTPLGLNVQTSWENLLAGVSGIAPITQFDASAFDSRIAGEVKGFQAEDHINAKQARRMDRFTQFGVATAKMLMEDSGYSVGEGNADRLGIIVGVGIGGLRTIEIFHEKLMKAGPSKVSPFMIPMLISNMAPGQMAIAIGAKGTNQVCTSACASGTHAVGSAWTEIVMGRCDAIVTGGVEATITEMGVSGFTALKALCSDHNDDPQHASRPFDKNRSGFVIGEGAGLLLLESLESATARGARIYAEIVGFGASCDAHHMTAPLESGEGMAACMRNALRDAGISPEDIGHINAHGTSTHMNDAAESKAIRMVFGSHADKIKVSATKSMTGHLLGAAGGVEAVFTVKALQEGMAPGTINMETPDPECDLDYVTHGSEKMDCMYAMSNSFGFGGTNASLIFKRWDGA
ncbi:MAG: beta-ketoacyl-ACP synthase II [Desulfovibrionaceae bacterium]|nr:beta-ketoacyl-ACP synthase II [Desulfovibrionaceae bacterium]